MDCWKLFFSEEIITKIVIYTNIYLAKLKENYVRSWDCLPTSVKEL